MLERYPTTVKPAFRNYGTGAFMTSEGLFALASINIENMTTKVFK